jgi:hypothetical protein
MKRVKNALSRSAGRITADHLETRWESRETFTSIDYIAISSILVVHKKT